MSSKPIKWNEWERISRDQVKKQNAADLQTFQKAFSKNRSSIRPFDLSRLETIHTKHVQQKKAILHAQNISKLTVTPRPKICALCGENLLKEAFVVFLPQKKFVCRGCLQSKSRCKNCFMPLKKSAFNVSLPEAYCKACQAKTTCHTSGKVISSEKRHQGIHLPGVPGFFLKEEILAGKKCIFCHLPQDWEASIKLKESVCTMCSGSLLSGADAFHSAHLDVTSFYRRIHVPRPFRPLNVAFHALHPYTPPDVLTVSFPSVFPMRLFYEAMLFHYFNASLHVKLPKTCLSIDDVLQSIMPEKRPSYQAFWGLVRYLFYHTKHFWIEAENIKKQLIGQATLKPLFKHYLDVMERVSIKKAYDTGYLSLKTLLQAP